MSARTANLDLVGKVVTVTGGVRGIGLATANAFARRGAVVAIGDLDAGVDRVAAEGIGRGATVRGFLPAPLRGPARLVNLIQPGRGVGHSGSTESPPSRGSGL